jgi:hypothetical protein
MDAAITAYYYETLPQEFLDDPLNPANDEFIKKLASLEQYIVDQCHQLHPDQITIIKMRHAGATIKEIAEAVDLQETSVRNACKRPKQRKLAALLAHRQLLLDAPHEAHRRNILWRIAARNEIADPRVTLSAISEMNKMSHNEKVLAAGLTGSTPVNITINNLLPKGALDN